jgi:cytoskeleton protein RodZ
MPDSFGARLRRRREERGIDLVTIAQQTKIKSAVLAALECDDVTQLPTGLYRRAFIRAYARAIDLDPDTVLREFLELFPEPPEIDILVAMAAARDPHIDSGPLDKVRSVVDYAIGSLSRLRRTDSPPAPVGADAAISLAHATPPPRMVAPLAVDPPRPTAMTASPVARDLELAISPEAESPATAVMCPPLTVSEESSVADDSLSDRRAAAPPPAAEAARTSEPDLMAVARLCTEFARVATATELHSLLPHTARVLHASGLIVWLWDATAGRLKAALAHGYPDHVVAQLPAVSREADNATALAFRSGEACAVPPTEQVKAALAMPLLTPAGCTGVLAIELQRGGELSTSIKASATILAAAMAQMTGHVPSAGAAHALAAHG